MDTCVCGGSILSMVIVLVHSTLKSFVSVNLWYTATLESSTKDVSYALPSVNIFLLRFGFRRIHVFLTEQEMFRNTPEN